MTAEESGSVPAEESLVRERYGMSLFLVFAAYLVAGVDDSVVMRLVEVLLWMTVLLAAVWSPAVPRRLRHTGTIVVAVALVLGVSLSFADDPQLRGVLALFLAAAQALAMLGILMSIARHREVHIQTILGAIVTYVLFGFMMASIYDGIDRLTASTFISGTESPSDYLYFSFVTLTTIGYGDMLPVSEMAKRLIVVEAVFGQIFRVTLVARLVSLWAPRVR